MTNTESDFIDQFARTLLVDWCKETLEEGAMKTTSTKAGPKLFGLCLAHALEKGWVSKTQPQRVLSKGFATASTFLLR